MLVSPLSDLVGDESAFFADYFGRAPYLNAGAFGESYRELLTVVDLDRIVNSEYLRPPYIQLIENSERVPTSKFTADVWVSGERVPDHVVPSKVLDCFRNGATIEWPLIDRDQPSLRMLAAGLSTRFGAPVDVTAFLRPAGTQACGPSCDLVDLFIIQLQGSSCWQLWPTSGRLETGVTRLDPAALGEASGSHSLRSGDVMYLPRNTFHVVAAERSTSLHLVVALRVRRRQDLLSDLVGLAVERDRQAWELVHSRHTSQDELEDQLTTAIGLLTRTLEAPETVAALAEVLARSSGSEVRTTGASFAELARAESWSENPGTVYPFFADLPD